MSIYLLHSKKKKKVLSIVTKSFRILKKSVSEGSNSRVEEICATLKSDL